MKFGAKFIVCSFTFLFLLIVSVLTVCLILVEQIRHQLRVPDCQIDPYNLYSPIVALHGRTEYIYPINADTRLRFSSGTLIDLICPGGDVRLGGIEKATIVAAKCISNTEFQVDNRAIDWKQINCSKIPEAIARRTKKTCQNGGTEIEIGTGFADLFWRTMLICFDEVKQQTLYSYLIITKQLNKRKLGPKPGWRGNLFKIKDGVDNVYKKDAQKRTINKLLGFSAKNKSYIQTDTDFFLSRGHLTARADNFYPSQQNHSYFLINAAPQWQIINGYNWEKVEISVRNLTQILGVNLHQWTGVFDVLKVNNIYGTATELYLYNQDGVSYIPVPKYFWKVVYHANAKLAVAVISLNDPYALDDDIFCPNILSKLTWLKNISRNSSHGRIYACEISDFRKNVTYLPRFDVKGVLL